MSNTVFSESISIHSKEALLEKRKIEDTKNDPEYADLLGNSTAVFSMVLSPEVPVNINNKLKNDVNQKIQEMQLFGSILAQRELNNLLQKNNRLNQAKEIYLDSLATVSVSNKDISNPLGKHLKTENFLVFQLDQWPCAHCSRKQEMRMKLRLVDAETGFIVWTGIGEAKNLTNQELEDIEGTAGKLADDLIGRFYNCFKKKWHKKRFSNLAKLSG